MTADPLRNGVVVVEPAAAAHDARIEDLDLLAAQAEAAADEAEAKAAEARARAAKIRTRLADRDGDRDDAGDAAAGTPPRRWWRLRRPGRATVLYTAAVLVIAGSLGASGLVLWQHERLADDHRRADKFAAAARDGVIALTTLDFGKAQQGVQRVLDDSMGSFKNDFQKKAQDFAKIVQDSKVVTEGTVHATAVQSMTRDSAVVLVAATSRVTNGVAVQDGARAWRLQVTVTRDGDSLKLSNVEFVP